MKKQNTALIIIDMQRGMASPQAGRRNNPDAEDNIKQLLTAWREAAAPIVFVRHMSRTPGSLFWPGQPGNEFQQALAPMASEYVVEKNVPDAFTHTGLERWLHVRGIKDLVITGVSTNNSVEATARSAGNLGFATTVVADACFCFDRLDLHGKPQTAEDIHIHALSNLQGEYAHVADTSALLN
ncbi:cysteine hydrolase family protein [Undibacterium sp. TJN19]|uniref:cysteine hydrolase family protein n=1 Tax=Undibacterium sp. TJN19 TaxID=3413055 RepID=UPI003BF382BF